MIKIAKTLAVAVAVTCMFAIASEQASAQCSRGGAYGYGGGYSSGYRGYGGGYERGLNISLGSRSSFYQNYRSSARISPYRNQLGVIPGRSYSYRTGHWHR